MQIQNPIELPEEDSEPQPDVTLLRPRADYYTAAHPVAADVLLVIEVADSTLAVDRRVRMPLYARAGIREAWILDLTADRVEVYRVPTADGYRQVMRFERGHRLAAEAFPDTYFIGVNQAGADPALENLLTLGGGDARVSRAAFLSGTSW